jgi:hypothetical protein
MSTRIYTGHEIIGHTLESFLSEIHRLRPEMEALAASKNQAFIVNHAAFAFDEYCVRHSVDVPRYNFIRAAIDELRARQDDVDLTDKRDPAVDTAFEVTVFPVDGRLLAVHFSDCKELTAIWTAQPWWKDLAYWDQSEGPEDLSEEEWAARRDVWNKVFTEDHASPAEAGYSVTVVGQMGYRIDLSDEALGAALAKELPDLECRANRLADDLSRLPQLDLPFPIDFPEGATRQERTALLKAELLNKLDKDLTLPKLRVKNS